MMKTPTPGGTAGSMRQTMKTELDPQDLKLIPIEQKIGQSYVMEDKVALDAAGLAYEIALANRYPMKVKHPMEAGIWIRFPLVEAGV